MVSVEEFQRAQRAEGPATIMAIGTATPSNCVLQSTYPDYYFRITKNQHKKELKEKFKRMCDKSMVKKRYMCLTEEILNEKPNFCAYMAPSLDERQEMAITEIPSLGAEAAAQAIKEWGQPKSMITHVVFCTTTGVDMPGADYQLLKPLGLVPSVKRVMMYTQGCFVGGMVLRVAKDIVENNKGARVLVVCSEVTVVTFRGPDEGHVDSLVGQALFSDGAAAIIVGSILLHNIEKPLFQIVSASQTVFPDSVQLRGTLVSHGLHFILSKKFLNLSQKTLKTAW